MKDDEGMESHDMWAVKMEGGMGKGKREMRERRMEGRRWTMASWRKKMEKERYWFYRLL